MCFHVIYLILLFLMILFVLFNEYLLKSLSILKYPCTLSLHNYLQV